MPIPKKTRQKREPVTDMFKDPGLTITEAELAGLPDSWQAAVRQSAHWPYADPDEVLEMDEHELAEVVEAKLATIDADLEVIPYSERQPWGRMDSESERQYELFCYFRSLGHARTQSEVARHFDVSRAYVSNIATSRGWSERIIAWDSYKEQVYAQTVLEGVKEMALKHAEIARDGIMALSKPFEVLMYRLESEEGIEELETMNLQSLFKLAQRSSQILPNLMNAERLSRGLPTEITEHNEHHTQTIRLETSDELAELLYGLATAIPGLESAEWDEGYIEAGFEEETSDDVARRAIAAAAKADS